MRDDQWDPGDPPEVYKPSHSWGVVCGEDFCEDCGDCLACYGEDECAVSGLPHGEQF